MSYSTFKPTLWAAQINRELERALVFAEDCNRQYEGVINKQGDTVRILGVGKPTITRTTTSPTLTGAEKVADTSISMPIRQIAYFNYGVDDVDKRQAVGGLMDILNKEATEGLAGDVDKYIAALYAGAGTITPISSLSKSTVLGALDGALEVLYGNDVNPATQIVATVSPKFWFKLKDALISASTDNVKMLENGKVGRYGNMIIKMSNNVAKNSSEYDQIMVRTQRAIAYCNPKTHTEAYRPENGFEDAVKGFILYDAMVVRPKELVTLSIAQYE